MTQSRSNAAETSIDPRPILDDLTVVIPTLGRPILEESLNRIASGSAWPAKLIVVDQSSSDTVAGWLARLCRYGLNAEHVPSCQRGKPAALNRGIERVTTRILAIIDDDCFAEADWLKLLRQHVYKNPDCVITGPAHPAGREVPVSAVTGKSLSISRRPGIKFDTFCGSNMGARVAVIHKVGVFDEDPCFIAAAEDCDWAYRALRARVPILYAPDVIVYHFGWRDADQRYSRYQLYARSHGSFYGKYLRHGDLLIGLRALIHHIRALKRWLTGAISGNREQMLNGRAYFTGLLPGILDRIRHPQ
jgi:GT2 family glycosyltransferase